MSSGGPCCAHLRVSWRTEVVPDGGTDIYCMPIPATRGWWECDSGCGATFWPEIKTPIRPNTTADVRSPEGPAPSEAAIEMIVEAEKAKVREHIKKMWKDTGPNQKIKLNLPRWFWEMAMRATAGAPSEGLRPADEGENAEGLSVVCRECGTLTAGVIAGNRVRWVTCAACFELRGLGERPAEDEAVREQQVEKQRRSQGYA